MIRADVVI